MTERFQVFKGADGQWYWREVARNGAVLSVSEGYTRKANARKGVKSAKANAAIAAEQEG